MKSQHKGCGDKTVKSSPVHLREPMERTSVRNLRLLSVSGHAIAIHIPNIRSKLSHFPDVRTWNPELRSDSRHIVA